MPRPPSWQQVLSIAYRPLSLVYIAVGDGGRAVAKFSKSRVWDKVSDENTLIFGDALISLKYSVG